VANIFLMGSPDAKILGKNIICIGHVMYGIGTVGEEDRGVSFTFRPSKLGSRDKRVLYREEL